MNCKSFRKALSLFQKGELPADERAAIEAHAQSCDDCRALLEEDNLLNSILDEAAAAGVPEAPGDLEQVLLRRWREQHAYSRLLDTFRKRAFRPILASSLALNALAVVALAVILAPRLAGLLPGREENGAQPEMLTPREMRMVFGEMESFFGPRLDWVAAVNGDISLGVLNGPETGAFETGQPVALTVVLESAADGAGEKSRLRSSVILARPSVRAREMILGEGNNSVEIQMGGLRKRGGRYLVEMNVRPLETAWPGETARSVLSSRVLLQSGEKTRLGQIRMGSKFWNVYLSLRLLGSNGETLHG